MLERARQPDWLGRGIGLAVFAAGIILLVLVFIWTNQLTALLPEVGQPLDQWAIRFGVNIARLFVSGVVASWIAGRGAQLYAASNRALSGE
jgi:multisubunit Na+/H+ antiporter MnhB subunit